MHLYTPLIFYYYYYFSHYTLTYESYVVLGLAEEYSIIEIVI